MRGLRGRGKGGISEPPCVIGRERFEQETGIRYTEWWGRHWSRWGYAVQEAGFAPNKLRDAYDDDELIEKLIGLIRESRRFPSTGDLRLKKRTDASFPNDKVFAAHFGPTAQLRTAISNYCHDHSEYSDVPELCRPVSKGDTASADVKPATEIVGFVYLMKHGRHYKIGKTNAIGRREYELAIQLPEKLHTIHVIKTYGRRPRS
jgi:hypothetical protein